MAKRHKKDRLDTQIQPSPKLVNEMRGLIRATRSRSDLRSLTPTQAKDRINDLYKEVSLEYRKTSQRRPSQGQVFGAQVSRRRETAQLSVLSQRVPPQVRDLFRDAERALVCSSRQTRREVMHAMRRTGKAGAGRNRKARWRSSSYITCKGR